MLKRRRSASFVRDSSVELLLNFVFVGQMIDDDFDMSTLLGLVLEESGYAESRASKMDVDDFLKYASSPFGPWF